MARFSCDPRPSPVTRDMIEREANRFVPADTSENLCGPLRAVMQDKHDLWVARGTVNLDGVHPLDFEAA